jgi:poly-gamma-glutamate synthesis protein (capsule biosynthesis protein)
MFRRDLALIYLVELDSRTGHLISAEFIPMQMRRFSLKHASAADARWLCDLMNRLSTPFDTGVQLEKEKSIIVQAR